MSDDGATFDPLAALQAAWSTPAGPREWVPGVKPREWAILTAKREPSSMRARRQPLSAEELAAIVDKALWLAQLGDYELAFAQVEAIAAEGDTALADALQVQIEAIQAGLDRKERAA